MSPNKPNVSSTVGTVPEGTPQPPAHRRLLTKHRLIVVGATVAVLVAGAVVLRPESSPWPYRDDLITVFGGGTDAARRSADVGDVFATEVVELGGITFVVGRDSDSSALYPVVDGRLGSPRSFSADVAPVVLGVAGDRVVAYDLAEDHVFVVDASGAIVASGPEQFVIPVLGPDGYLWWRQHSGKLVRQRVDDLEGPAKEPAPVELANRDLSAEGRTLVGAGVGRVFVAIDDECDEGLIAIDPDGREEQLIEFPRASSCRAADESRVPISNVSEVAEDSEGNLWIGAIVLGSGYSGLFVLRASDGEMVDVTRWIGAHPFLGRGGFQFDAIGVDLGIRFDAGRVKFVVRNLEAGAVVEVDDIDSLLAQLQPIPLLSAAGLPNVPPPLNELQLAASGVSPAAVSAADTTLLSEFNPRTLNRWYLNEIGKLSQVDPDGTIISSISAGTPFGGAYAYDDGVMLLTCPASCDSSRVLTFVHGDGSVERRPLPVGHQVDVLIGVDPERDRVMLLSGGDDVAFTKWWLPWPSAVDPIDTGIGTGEIDAGLDAQGRVILMRAGRLVIVGNDGDIALTAPLTAEQQTVPTVVQLTRGPVTLDQLSLDVDAVATGPDGTTFIATTDGIVLSARGGEPVRYLAGGAEFVNGASGDLGIIYRLSVVDGSLFIDAGSIFRIDLDDL
jgi:hypothetical protein